MKNSAASYKDFGLILLCIVASLAVFVAFLMTAKTIAKANFLRR